METGTGELLVAEQTLHGGLQRGAALAPDGVKGAWRSSRQKTQRFGFVECGEGPGYFTVNGVRINMISDGTPEPAIGEYDCYSASPAFLPTTGFHPGLPRNMGKVHPVGDLCQPDVCTVRSPTGDWMWPSELRVRPGGGIPSSGGCQNKPGLRSNPALNCL